MPHRNNLMHKVTNFLLLLLYSSFRDVSLWHPLHFNIPGQVVRRGAVLCYQRGCPIHSKTSECLMSPPLKIVMLSFVSVGSYNIHSFIHFFFVLFPIGIS